MAIPKRSNAAAAQQLRATKGGAPSDDAVEARKIFANDRTPREKITLTMEVALKREVKIAAATEGVTISDLVDKWAREWLSSRTQ